ncbi:MAG: zinc-dependent alcohol dehydrogenase family protein [Steroidobacteraceae bacterium]
MGRFRRALHERYGDPRDVLKIVEVDDEYPAADEIVIRMEAAAMHIADLRTIEGAEMFRNPLPRTPGFEGVGRVLRVGSAVTTYSVGDRVFPALASGTFSEQVRCAASRCMPAPEGDAVQLSLLTVNGPTAAVLLDDFVKMNEGDWLIQNAANSNCGRFLLQLAHQRGIKTVNIVRRAEMIDELVSLGADIVLLDGPDLAERVSTATSGASIRLGIDAVAGSATRRIAECLATEAKLICYGAMSSQHCEIDFYRMFRLGIEFHALSFVRQLSKRNAQDVRALYADLAEKLATGALTARIAGRYRLEEIIAACDRAAMTGSERDGKVVVVF